MATLPVGCVLTLADEPRTIDMEVVTGSYFDFFNEIAELPQQPWAMVGNGS